MKHLLSSALSLATLLWVVPALGAQSQEPKQESKAVAGRTKAAMPAQQVFLGALTRAYGTNPDLHKAIRQYYKSAEGIPAALSGWMPTINGKLAMENNHQKTDGYRYSLDSSAIVGTDTRTNAKNRSGQLTLSQNLFNGMRSYNNLSQAENTLKASQANVLNAEQTVLFKAVDAYFKLWQSQKVLAFRQASEKFQQRNYDEVKAQADVGEKAITDVAESQSRLSSATADRIQAESDLEAARATYLQVVGEEPIEVEMPEQVLNGLGFPASLEELRKRSEGYNPSIQQAFYSEKAASDNVSVAEGALSPSVDFSLSGSRTWAGQKEKVSRVGNRSRNNNGAIGLTMTIPIYQGGAEWVKIRQAIQDEYTAKNDLRSVKRVVDQACVATWNNWQASKKNVDMYRLSVKAAELNLEGKRQEYLVGERTLTDMLQAESQLVQAQTSMVQALAQHYTLSYQMLSLFGNLLPESIGLSISRYNVQEYADDARYKLIGAWGTNDSLEPQEQPTTVDKAQ